jgi:hypothetical protein
VEETSSIDCGVTWLTAYVQLQIIGVAVDANTMSLHYAHHISSIQIKQEWSQH